MIARRKAPGKVKEIKGIKGRRKVVERCRSSVGGRGLTQLLRDRGTGSNSPPKRLGSRV